MNISVIKILRMTSGTYVEDISSKIQNDTNSITINITEPLLFSLVLKVVFIIKMRRKTHYFNGGI